jgi:hypothetical protein
MSWKNMVKTENIGTKYAVVAEKFKKKDVDQSRRKSPAQQAAEFLGDEYIRLCKNIIDKKGIGINKRLVYFTTA